MSRLHRSRTLHGAIVVLAATLTATAAACSAEETSTADVPGLPGPDVAAAAGDERRRPIGAASGIDTIVMVGDSITVASRDALDEAFQRIGFEHVVIVSQSGKRIALSFGDNPSGAAVVETLLVDAAAGADDAVSEALGTDRSDELWVLALGTNDIEQYDDPSERVAAVNELLRAVPVDVPLVWVDTYFRDRPEGAAEINAMIADRLAARGADSTIARWSEVADEEGVLRTDGVHPREEGTVAFARVVADAVARLR